MTIDSLVQTLHARGRHPKYRAKCPVHRSHGLTLAIYADKGEKIGLHCHAGCEKDDVLAALGLTWKDLKPQKDWLSPEAFRELKRKEREAEEAANRIKRQTKVLSTEVNRWERIAAMMFTQMLGLGRTPEALYAADLWHKALHVARQYRERLWAVQKASGVGRNKLGEVDCYVVPKVRMP